jgi:hypothetical protein
MLVLFVFIILNLNIGCNYIELKEDSPYSFDIPSNHSAYITSSMTIDDDFHITFKNEPTQEYKGYSENKGHSFYLDSEEVIIQSDNDNAKTQIWNIEKGICDNVAYTFQAKKHSELKFTFLNQEKMCLFFPFLSPEFHSTTIKSNQHYLVFDRNMNVLSSNGDKNHIQMGKPFFLYFNDSLILEKVQLTIDFENNNDLDNCDFEPFSYFDHENGFISNIENLIIQNESFCLNVDLPWWSILLIVLGSIILAGILITCCCCCCGCCCGKCCECMRCYLPFACCHQKIYPKPSRSSSSSKSHSHQNVPNPIPPVYDPNIYSNQYQNLVSPVCYPHIYSNQYQNSVPPVYYPDISNAQHHDPEMADPPKTDIPPDSL